MKNKEIEIQVQIEKIELLKNFLKKNAELLGKKRQVDEYFCPPDRNFLSKDPVEEWFRLRNTEGKLSLNYKNWHFDKNGRSHFCDEYETAVESFENAALILKSLKFKSLVKVDKTRTTYKIKDYLISLDEVKDLGDFVEIEFKGESDKTPAEITDEMILWLRKAISGKITRNYIGYPAMMLFPKRLKLEEL